MQSAAEQLSLFANKSKPDSSESGFSVRVSGRAKRLSIKVYPRGRVEVVAPKRARARDVQAFVAEHRDWIEQTQKSFAEQIVPETLELPSTIALPAVSLGVQVVYRDDPSTGKKVNIRQHDEMLVLNGAVRDHGACVAALKRWLKSVARRHFEPQLQRLSQETGNPYKRVQIRGQRTCWGSHSSNGTVSLNYSLLFLDPALLRYLLIHELCHARHMNHSVRYWRHVETFEPDYRQLDQRLAEAWREIPPWLGIH